MNLQPVSLEQMHQFKVYFQLATLIKFIFIYCGYVKYSLYYGKKF